NQRPRHCRASRCIARRADRLDAPRTRPFPRPCLGAPPLAPPPHPPGPRRRLARPAPGPRRRLRRPLHPGRPLRRTPLARSGSI
ncbi:MAG: hypothetical protein AVDCRST_MAG77-5546, partial [uncultured Chloroflexi bacterium]